MQSVLATSCLRNVRNVPRTSVKCNRVTFPNTELSRNDVILHIESLRHGTKVSKVASLIVAVLLTLFIIVIFRACISSIT